MPPARLTPPRSRDVEVSALALVAPHPALGRLAKSLSVAFLLLAVFLLLAPWVQTAPGEGRVVAWAPDERQQVVEAPINGRAIHWFVREGDRVQAGDPVVELSDNDPELMARLESERQSLREQLEANIRRTAALRERQLAMRARREAALLSADERVRVAESRLAAAEQQVAAELAGREAVTLNASRVEALAGEGLSSQRDRELATMNRQQADAALARAEAALQAAGADARAARFDRTVVERDLDAQIAAIEADLEASIAAEASAASRLPDMDVEIARQHNQVVRCTRDGTVLRIVAGQGGEQVKAGDPLLVVVPTSVERAVELWVDGNDASLLTVDQSVRLRFEGWPALQFSGWPSVAVGTFGGQVAFIDAADDGAGKFRALVVPDPGEPAWPEERWLRQGTRARGWVMLSEVPIGYELWRQLNDFPPALQSAPAESKSKEAKK